jgi:transposase
MTEVACWAHVRRKIYDVHLATNAPIAAAALERIGRLFDVERDVTGLAPDTRRQIRQARACPVIDELAAFLDGSLPKLSGKGELAGAMRYARGRWEALTRYLDDGRLEISNNAAERAIRPLALGRKNYMFAGSDAGGDRAAAIYTLVETTKLNGLDPEAYLRDLLGRIADHPITGSLTCCPGTSPRTPPFPSQPDAARQDSKPQPAEDAYRSSPPGRGSSM